MNMGAYQKVAKKKVKIDFSALKSRFWGKLLAKSVYLMCFRADWTQDHQIWSYRDRFKAKITFFHDLETDSNILWTF